MFIRIEDTIINTTEIQCVKLEKLGYGKGTVDVYFKNSQNIYFSERKLDECAVIIDTIAEACLGKKS